MLYDCVQTYYTDVGKLAIAHKQKLKVLEPSRTQHLIHVTSGWHFLRPLV